MLFAWGSQNESGDVFQTDRPMIRNMVWDVVKTDLNKLASEEAAAGGLTEDQFNYCRDNNLTLTPHFKQQLRHVTNTLEAGNSHLLLFGKAVTQKTALWRAAAVIKNYQVIVVSR